MTYRSENTTNCPTYYSESVNPAVEIPDRAHVAQAVQQWEIAKDDARAHAELRTTESERELRRWRIYAQSLVRINSVTFGVGPVEGYRSRGAPHCLDGLPKAEPWSPSRVHVAQESQVPPCSPGAEQEERACPQPPCEGH
jgi:hypothetical protein